MDHRRRNDVPNSPMMTSSSTAPRKSGMFNLMLAKWLYDWQKVVRLAVCCTTAVWFILSSLTLSFYWTTLLIAVRSFNVLGEIFAFIPFRFRRLPRLSREFDLCIESSVLALPKPFSPPNWCSSTLAALHPAGTPPPLHFQNH